MKPLKRTHEIPLRCCAVLSILSIAAAAQADKPVDEKLVPNGNGLQMIESVPEHWSAADRANAAGYTARSIGMYHGALSATNAGGLTISVGDLDPPLPGGVEPTLTPTPSPSPTPEESPSPTPSESPTPSLTPSPTVEPSPSPSPTPSPTIDPGVTPSLSPSPSLTPSPSPTEEITPSPTPSPTEEVTPSATPTASATPSPSLTASPSPTPTVTPSPSPTGTETVTPSPTPVVEPPTIVDFPFDAGAEGWQFFNPTLFATVTGSYSQAEQALRSTVTENTDSFAFWESPQFVIGKPPVVDTRGVVFIDGLIGPQSLYRSTFSVESTLASGANAPTIRVRSSSFNFEQSDVLVVTSTGDGSLSPSTAGSVYTQYFSQPTGVDSFRLDFDVLNFDPADATNASLFLTQVTVEALGVPQVQGTVLTEYDFVANGPSGFTARNASPVLATPSSFISSDGLGIRGLESLATRGVAPAQTIFGYWGAETDVPIEGGKLHGITFRVRSDATAAQRATVPTFRLRVNESSLNLSAYLNIDSRDDATRVPVDGETESYTLWLLVPQELDGQKFIFSFDYLWSPESDDDSTITLTMEGITVTSFTAP